MGVEDDGVLCARSVDAAIDDRRSVGNFEEARIDVAALEFANEKAGIASEAIGIGGDVGNGEEAGEALREGGAVGGGVLVGGLSWSLREGWREDEEGCGNREGGAMHGDTITAGPVRFSCGESDADIAECSGSKRAGGAAGTDAAGCEGAMGEFRCATDDDSFVVRTGRGVGSARSAAVRAVDDAAFSGEAPGGVRGADAEGGEGSARIAGAGTGGFRGGPARGAGADGAGGGEAEGDGGDAFFAGAAHQRSVERAELETHRSSSAAVRGLAIGADAGPGSQKRDPGHPEFAQKHFEQCPKSRGAGRHHGGGTLWPPNSG